MTEKEILDNMGPGNIQEVVISFHNEQDVGGNASSMEFITDGLYSYADGTGKLCYFESDVTGFAGTKTDIAIAPNEIVLNRAGRITSTMVFSEGNRNPFLYNTPYGEATLWLHTRHIDQTFDEHGGDMQVDYDLHISPGAALRNRFRLSVRPQ